MDRTSDGTTRREEDRPRVELPASVLARYRAFSLYNSPYPAHDGGCAIDLYPETNAGLSPVAGDVVDTRTVRAPSKPYAVAEDHLVVVDVDVDATGLGIERERCLARVLHVDPAVEPGDTVAVGDSLGEMVRSGFFAPWVDNHVHLGFRTPEQNAHRASGSLPVDVGTDPVGLPWDGRGTVVEAGETYVVLDAPTLSGGASAEFVGIAADDGGVLDGGLPHYAGGGSFGASTPTVSLFGTVVGRRTPDDGRTLSWADVSLTADGVALTGLSLFVARPDAFGAKLVCPGHPFDVGQTLRVRVDDDESSSNAIAE